MATHRSPGEDRTWAHIERERRIDRLVRRLTIGAWAVTLLLVLVLVVLTGLRVAEMIRLTGGAIAPWSIVTGAALPLLIVLALLSVLIATLGTVAVFLRLRTASLVEIQLRLAALEEMLVSRADDSGTEHTRR